MLIFKKQSDIFLLQLRRKATTNELFSNPILKSSLLSIHSTYKYMLLHRKSRTQRFEILMGNMSIQNQSIICSCLLRNNCKLGRDNYSIYFHMDFFIGIIRIKLNKIWVVLSLPWTHIQYIEIKGLVFKILSRIGVIKL